MIPDMYEIAGELTPTVIHVAARSLAAQGLSIFGDHQDVMAVRQTGFAILGSTSVQEAHDMAAVAQGATLESRVPFIHFFDGFRTSHELNSVEMLSDQELLSLVPVDLVHEHRSRSLNPERPVIRGTSQNPDVYFQARETVNPFYSALAAIVQRQMDRLATMTGRTYRIAEYHGHPKADRVIVAMGSATRTLRHTVEAMARQGERVGAVTLRLYRPFPADLLLQALPATTRRLGVLDRTKEPGSLGEPLEHSRGVITLRTGNLSNWCAGDAMDCPRRSSRRPWCSGCSTSSARATPAGISPSA
jgi:pyruvate-ferredoxin/flavodoxin oxidoreductase